jgi:hypothetical protein
MAGMDEDDMVSMTELKEAVADWVDRHEPLSRAALNTVDSKFMRGRWESQHGCRATSRTWAE